MYEDYFGLKRPPFATTPDPSMLYLTGGHREVLAGLTYAVMCRKGFIVLAGQAGTGKTTVIRKLLKVISTMQVRLSVVFNPTLTASEFLELILINFGVSDVPDSKAQRLHLLQELLVQAQREGQNCVLIIDEAHKLTADLLEEIRLLSNFESDDEKLLQIVLAGQPEIDDVLNQHGLWQLKQRIAMRVHTTPLTLADINAYLSYRWKEAQSAQPLPFTKEAIGLVALWSRGIPRLINIICDNALLLAMASGVRHVESAHVLDAVRDLNLKAAPSPEPEEGGEPIAKAATASEAGEQPVTTAAPQSIEAPACAAALQCDSKGGQSALAVTEEPAPVAAVMEPPRTREAGPLFERFMPPPKRSLRDRWAARFRT